MDKQMIEEMADVMVKYALNIDGALPAIKSAMQDVGVKKAIKKVLWGYAGALYNAGYCKIPENAVVLTRAEYEKVKYVLKYEPEEAIIRLQDLKKNEALYSPHMFCSIGGCGGVSKDCNYTCPNSRIVQERKKTAEKFAEMVSKAFIGLNCIDIDEWNWCQNKIDEIAKGIIDGK